MRTARLVLDSSIDMALSVNMSWQVSFTFRTQTARCNDRIDGRVLTFFVCIHTHMETDVEWHIERRRRHHLVIHNN
jgi:hypothetical protein